VLTAITSGARTVSIPRAAVGAVGALAAVVGIAVAIFFAVAPLHMTVQRRVPVQVAGGEFNMTLSSTGQSTLVSTRVTCVPIQGVVAPRQEPDATCLPKDRHRDRLALVGLAAFVAGGIAWQTAGVAQW